MGGCFLSGDRFDMLLGIRFDVVGDGLLLLIFGERQVWLDLLSSHHRFRLGHRRWRGSRFHCGGLRGRNVFVGEIEVVVRSSELNAQQVGGEFAPRIIVFVFGRAGGRRLFGHERSVVHEGSALGRTGRVTSRQTSRQTGRDYGVCTGFLQQTPQAKGGRMSAEGSESEAFATHPSLLIPHLSTARQRVVSAFRTC